MLYCSNLSEVQLDMTMQQFVSNFINKMQVADWRKCSYWTSDNGPGKSAAVDAVL